MAKTVSPGVQALRDVVEKVYRELREAKEAGEPVGWSSSKFPCELAESFGLHVGYPENQAAGIAANRDGEVMCQAAEDIGYDNDICGYARISLAYAAGYRGANKMDKDGNYIINPNSGKQMKDANGKKVFDENGKPVIDPKTRKPYATTDNIYEIAALPDGEEKTRRQNALHKYRQMTMPMPDFVLCCNNICNCMTKWYEDIARRHNIPLIMIDVPYNEFDHVNEANVKYIRSQLDTAIRQMEEISGKKFDEDKFEQCCQNANRTAKAWLKVCDYLQYKPSPFNGFDLFNHMADVVTARGRVEAAEAFELLASELEQHVKDGTTTAPFKEQYRIMFEGIACWPYLRVTSSGLKNRGINMVTTIYADAFGFDYHSFDEMIKLYCMTPNAINLEQSRDKRIRLCKDNHVEGLLVHTNRSCKMWSGFMPEMSRQIGEACNIPVVAFDGDQADPRNFSEAQYETRVQGLAEIMEANKEVR